MTVAYCLQVFLGCRFATDKKRDKRNVGHFAVMETPVLAKFIAGVTLDGEVISWSSRNQINTNLVFIFFLFHALL